MKFLNILKRPFQYDEDIDQMELKDSLINIGISTAICMITIILAVIILSSKVIGAVSGLLGGFGGLGGKVTGKIVFTVFYSSLIGYIIGLAVMIGLIFLSRRIANKEASFKESLSLVSSSIVIPSAIAPITLIGVIFGNALGIWISGIILLITFIILLINLFEGLKVVGGVGSGRAIYLVSSSVILYYGLLMYVMITIVTQSMLSSLNYFY